MAYFNPVWWLEDEMSELIYTKETANMSPLNLKIDREVELRYQTIGRTLIADIPVDGSGYITALVMINYTIAYAVREMFVSYWGVAGVSEDIYHEKLAVYDAKVQDARSMLTESSMAGLVDDDGDLKPRFATVNSVVVY